ncbi:hypothetical protein ASD83_02400 [Devosia sp. Root685]|uniref:YbaN family protein n=1 Tax=Devosia sp. Root685 TaxID=1736587 RepID=UPI0006FE09FA|nr:YbaN family protein [Devosia sp. Root685]KRA99396.1 hypothetical protein ASD83_02400 [Devosia sp. Root685]
MSEPQSPLARNRLVRFLYLVLGLLLLITGIIGIFVPLMPTTIFLILAAWCFSKSSRRLESWLLGHATLGPTIVNWRRHGVISPRAKLMACTGMAAGFLIFLFAVHPAWWLFLLVAAIMGGCAWYVLSRPSAPRSQETA